MCEEGAFPPTYGNKSRWLIEPHVAKTKKKITIIGRTILEFEFKLLTKNDYDLIHNWLNRKHVADRWDGPQTLEAVIEKFDRKIASNYVFPYLVYMDGQTIGYIQSYQADLVGDGWWEDEPKGTWGVDQYVAEENLLGKGIGPKFLRQFTDMLLSRAEVSRVITDPDPLNTFAVRAYEKAGFSKLGIRSTPDGPALIMERT